MASVYLTPFYTSTVSGAPSLTSGPPRAESHIPKRNSGQAKQPSDVTARAGTSAANLTAGSEFTAELRTFLRAFPRYGASRADALRKAEYSRLDAHATPTVYLDYAGGGLHAEHSQLGIAAELLRGVVLGNPHSRNPSSEAAERSVEQARLAVAQHFHAEGQYEVIFTHNASAAVKLVGQSYPFEQPGSRLLLLTDNHNSVNGLREYARAAGATVSYLPVSPPELRASDEALQAQLERGSGSEPGRGLLAYPAQSNFSGVQHP
eukprot:RCo011951